MEIDDNEVDQTTLSNGLNDAASTLEEWVPECDAELKPTINWVFDTLEEEENFYNGMHMLLALVYTIQLKIKIKMVLGENTFFAQV